MSYQFGTYKQRVVRDDVGVFYLGYVNSVLYNEVFKEKSDHT